MRVGRWWRGACFGAALASAGASGAASRLSDQQIPLDPTISERPRPLLELGEKFLGTGPLSKAFELPTGAVWQPSLVVYGTLRTAVQTFDDGKNPRVSEWANRLSVFSNLQLSGTERAVIGFRPLDKDGRHYFGQEFEPHEKFRSNLDGNVDRLFFEGDFGQIFPHLDLYDRYALDYGFSVGRQPLVLQDGMLLNDLIDSLGIVRNTLEPSWASNWRLTALYGWNRIHRNNFRQDSSAQLVGFDSSADFSKWGTLDVDGLFVPAGHETGDGVYGGTSLVRRVIVLGRSFNTTVRVNGSYAVERETPETRSGVLLYGEVSRTPNQTGNFAYANGFVGIDHFSSAARHPDAGGPLGRTGILFEAIGVGKYGSALGNFPDKSVGGAAGYQMFFANTRRQLVVELGGRKDTDGSHQGAVALGGRLQQAVGHHVVLQLDSFVAGHEGLDVGYGGRCEMLLKF
jgi:hypothetical protein